MENVIQWKSLMSGKFWKLSHSYDYQSEIFRLSWNLKTYMYKSRSESWKVLHVFEILLITTFTNTKVERMFSRIARIKTDWRNCLGRDRLDSLLRIFEESQSLGKFDPTPAIERWFNDKVLRLSSSSHKYPEKYRRLEERTMVDIATLTMTDLEDEEDNFVNFDWTFYTHGFNCYCKVIKK